MKKPLVMFVITALLIIAGAMAYQAFKHGAFEGAHPADTNTPEDVEAH